MGWWSRSRPAACPWRSSTGSWLRPCPRAATGAVCHSIGWYILQAGFNHQGHQGDVGAAGLAGRQVALDVAGRPGTHQQDLGVAAPARLRATAKRLRVSFAGLMIAASAVYRHRPRPALRSRPASSSQRSCSGSPPSCSGRLGSSPRGAMRDAATGRLTPSGHHSRRSNSLRRTSRVGEGREDQHHDRREHAAERLERLEARS